MIQAMNSTSEIIKKARQQRKLTQSELATKIALQTGHAYTRAALSLAETGDTNDMKPVYLFAACEILGIDPKAAVAGELKWVDDAPTGDETPEGQAD